MSLAEIRDLSAGYGERKIVKNLSFSLEAGEICGILGANGCGKTTLLKAVCGILPHIGQCRVEDRVLEGLTPKKIGQLCGYIHQRSGISIDISVLDVVLMGFNPVMGLLERPSSSMKEKALAVLGEAGLADFADYNYLHLSEGQKQLCILARTLVSEGKLLLLDEPESALDFRYRGRMMEILRYRVREGAALVTLHDPNLALNRCDRLLLLDEGRVLAVLDPMSDSADFMETQLSKIYGPVTLHRCRDKQGSEQFVMLREDDV